MDPLKIVQISDLHLFCENNKDFLGVNTKKSFKAVLSLLEANHAPDIILLGGDLSQDQSEDAYRWIAEQLKPFQIPIYYIPGNHDNKLMMDAVYKKSNILGLKHIVTKNWDLILLDSQKPGFVEGFLNQEQLDFLKNCLEHSLNHTAIVLHHHPVSVGSQWLDKIGLKNANEFWEIIDRYPTVKCVLFSHIHQEYQGTIKHIQCFSSPSTCFQFKKNSIHFSLDNIPPGYRWIELNANGDIKTKIFRVPKYIGTFDKNATGY